MELEAQGRDSTFTFCYAHLKKVILEGKRANGMNIKWPEVCPKTLGGALSNPGESGASLMIISPP